MMPPKGTQRAGANESGSEPQQQSIKALPLALEKNEVHMAMDAFLRVADGDIQSDEQQGSTVGLLTRTSDHPATHATGERSSLS